LQPLLRGRVSPNIELEHVENGGEALDRLMRDLFLGRAELPQRRGRHETDQKTEDGQHDQQLQQCEAALLPAVSIAPRSCACAAQRGRPAPMPRAVPLQMIGLFKIGFWFYAEARQLHPYFLQWQLTDCLRGPASSVPDLPAPMLAERFI